MLVNKGQVAPKCTVSVEIDSSCDIDLVKCIRNGLDKDLEKIKLHTVCASFLMVFRHVFRADKQSHTTPTNELYLEI